MQEHIKPKVGRTPKRAEPGTSATLTLRFPAEVKNLMIDQAIAYGLTLTEYITALVRRDGGA